MSADRNLLFGILALQNDFVTRDQLIEAMNAWVLEKQTSLGEILKQRGSLRPDDFDLLQALVQRQIDRYHGAVGESLAALDVGSSIRKALAGIDDRDIRGTLAFVDREFDPSASTLDPAPPRKQNGVRYQIVRSHAAGGLGEVFVAVDTELHREIALKLIKDRHADRPEARARFVVEAEVTGGLEHPGIVPVYGLGHYADGRPFYAMRFIRGDSLKDAIERFHGLSHFSTMNPILPKPDFASLAFRNLLRRFIDVCNAVAYAHSRGVLHRDLKPGNIMLGKYGETLVVDWGLAKALGKLAFNEAEVSQGPLIPASGSGSGTAAVEGTLPGSAIGTPGYMSPEQAAGRLDQLGPATDVYSLGATLFCVLAGKQPLEGKDLPDMLHAVEVGDIPTPRSVQPAIPPALEAICTKAMSLRPADRYTTPLALAEDLEHWLADEPVTTYSEPIAVRARRWLRKRALLATSVAVAAVVGLIASAIGLVVIGAKNRDLDAALASESKERKLAVANEQKAEAEFRRAKKAVDDYFTAVSESKELTKKYPGMHELRLKLLEKAQTYYEEFLKERGNDPNLQADTALALSNRASVAAATGRKADALAGYLEAIQIREKLARDNPQSDENNFGLASAYNNLGVLQQALGKFDEALASFRSAIGIKEKLARDHPNEPDYTANLASSIANLGEFQRIGGKPQDAFATHLAAFKVFEKLAKENPSVPAYLFSLAGQHNNLGVLQNALGKPRDALVNYQAALKIYLDLARSLPDRTDFASALAKSHVNLAQLQDTLNKRDEAHASYQAAIKILTKLVDENPSVTEFAFILAGTHSNLGELQREGGKLSDAMASAKAALKIREKHARDNPTVTDYASGLAASYGNLGNIQFALRKNDDALASYQAALKIREKLVRDNPKVTEYAVHLGIGYLNLGKLILETSSPKDSLAYLDKAIKTLGGPAKINVTAREILQSSHWDRAIAFALLERFDEALADFDVALKLDDGSKAKQINGDRENALAERAAKQSKQSKSAKPGPAVKN